MTSSTGVSLLCGVTFTLLHFLLFFVTKQKKDAAETAASFRFLTTKFRTTSKSSLL
jgi:Na+/H+ antiporter NhaA